MWHNIINQLLLPKIVRTLEEWKASELPLHAWLFPWVPFLRDSFAPLFEPVRRSLAQQVKKQLSDQSLMIITPWLDVLPQEEIKKLVSSSILPQLVSTLRAFKINPQNQDIQHLLTVLKWKNILGGEVTSYLLETEFFNKWHDALWRWITSPGARFDEITQVCICLI
jgi:tuftelin-interacting protein 11